MKRKIHFFLVVFLTARLSLFFQPGKKRVRVDRGPSMHGHIGVGRTEHAPRRSVPGDVDHQRCAWRQTALQQVDLEQNPLEISNRGVRAR